VGLPAYLLSSAKDDIAVSQDVISSAASLPWAPLYSVTRAQQPEVTVYGLAFVWAEDRAAKNNCGLALLRVGETRTPLWSRSLLKPFQLMVLYPTLKQAYPSLTPAHWAMLMASHQGDARQLELLQDLMTLGGFNEADLQCPACQSHRAQNPREASALQHPCSGKHLAHLLYLKARDLPLNHYLQPDQEPYQLLRALLCYLLYVDALPESVDGCGMPNLALTAVELAQLYHALVLPVSKDMIRQCPDELTDILMGWNEIAAIMQAAPELIGGAGRLDTCLMQGEGLPQPAPALIAKEGAEGLLCLGIGPSESFPGGLGLLIKLSAGHKARQMDVLIRHILAQLGLAEASMPTDEGVTQTVFHFQVQGALQAL
jgi:L-asparaginase